MERNAIGGTPVKKFIVWGCKLHEHTNSYVYAGFYKAAKAMGMDAYWIYPNSNVSGMDFSDSVFFTEGQHDGGIPIRDDCTYILHNCTSPKWQTAKRKIVLQTYTHDADHRWKATPLPGFPGSFVLPGYIFQPWATDLLPDEIDMKWADITRLREIHWVGTYGAGKFGNENEINPFRDAALAAGYSWSIHLPGSTSFEQNRELIQRSAIAPTITGKWQTENGYIPCRLFKNSSYGHLVVTNNKACYNLLEGLGVYSPNTQELFFKALEMVSNKKLIRDAMQMVKDRHTFINRINAILAVI
jgi:hypothetical protein